MTKSELRVHFKDRLQKHFASQDAVSESQKKLVQNVLKFVGEHTGTWGSYQPLPQEASMLSVAEARRDLRWVYPRLHSGKLIFCVPELWEQIQFKIRQPTADCEVIPLDKIHGMLIPGLAFDRQGNRLGRGKGFYDQTLGPFRGMKVAVGFQCQISTGLLPAQPHDIKMDWVITEDMILDCR